MVSAQQASILKIINENGAAGAALLSIRLGISRQAVHKQLQQMLASDLVIKKGKPPKTIYMSSSKQPKSTNITKHDYHVTKIHRRDKNNQRSAIIWFTGFSGSGKSTLANAVERKLFEMGKNTYVLDGDNIRHGLNKDLTFSAKDRTENIRRIGEVANLMVEAGVFVMTAFISPYRSDRNMVRSLVEKDEFIEVYVKCPLKVCESRDVKGLYEKARKGQIKDFTGIDAPYEAPENPELIVETDKYSIDECVDQIVQYMKDKEYLKRKKINLIKPYQSDTLQPLLAGKARIKEIKNNVKKHKQVVISSAAAANAVMLGSGYFSPLAGYMTLADSLQIAEDFHTTAGMFWPIPITNRLKNIDDLKEGDEVVLLDPNVEGNPAIALQKIEKIDKATPQQIKKIAKAVFGTLDPNHPGVTTFIEQGQYYVSGPIEVLNFSYFEIDFPDTFSTAVQIRDEIKRRGWNNVVAFQTRNPMHRAHEELCKIAMDHLGADGIVIHMLLGKLKKGDVPASVRDKAIRTMVDNYFPKNSAMITGYGFDMLYAGPREAVLHAIFRQNMGANHFIIGRDHAGVGDYYGPFDAHYIFDHHVPKNALEINIFRADHAAYSKSLGRVIMFRDAPQGHKQEDYVILSGTKVREMLKNGQAPPEEFSRPEVAQILIEWATSQNSQKRG